MLVSVTFNNAFIFFLIYGRIFYETLESCVQPPAIMKIRCYETSPAGIGLAQKAGYELVDISNHNTRTFFKMKR